jgi:hypothetical protein
MMAGPAVNVAGLLILNESAEIGAILAVVH